MGTHDFILPFQQRLLDQVDMALEEIQGGGNSQGIRFIGPSGTGKSHGLDLTVDRHGRSGMDGYQRIDTCCRVTAMAKADAVSTAKGILTQLGKPMPAARGNANLPILEASMQAALMAHKVKILILEEFHNAMLAGSPQLRGQTSRILKNLWNQSPLQAAGRWAIPDPQRGDYRLLIILSGTDELTEVFEQDPELASRFSCVVETSQLGFSTPESIKNFRYVYLSLAERFGLAERLNANDDGVVARFLVGCEAHLRKLETLLQRVATLARRQEVPAIGSELLAAAFDQVGSTSLSVGNPFLATDEQLAAHIVRLQSLAKISSFPKGKGSGPRNR